MTHIKPFVHEGCPSTLVP